MFRRTFLKIAAVCLIHPALNWTNPPPVYFVQFPNITCNKPPDDGYVDIEFTYIQTTRRRHGIVTPNV